MSEAMRAQDCAPSSWPAKSAFLRLRVTGLIWFSTKLLSISTRPSSYRASEAPEEIVRSLVIGKIANQRAVLMRALRDHGSEMPPETRAAIETAADRLARVLRRATYAD